MTGRALLERIPAELDAARQVRYEPEASFAELTLDEIDNAARWLRAASYSCTTGARKLEQIARTRREKSA